MKAPAEDRSKERAIIERVLREVAREVTVSEIDSAVLRELTEGSIIGKPRDKQWKDTESWSANSLIKLLFKLKELSPADY